MAAFFLCLLNTTVLIHPARCKPMGNWAVVADDKAAWIFLFFFPAGSPCAGAFQPVGLVWGVICHLWGAHTVFTPAQEWIWVGLNPNQYFVLQIRGFFLTRLKAVLSCALVIFSVSAHSPQMFPALPTSPNFPVAKDQNILIPAS